jgi:hypothetical protein
MASKGPALDPAGDFGEDGRLVSAAGAHLEDPLSPTQSAHLCHERDDVGLADGLAKPDGVRAVLVRPIREVRGKKLVPGNGAHGREHRGVLHATAGDLAPNHLKPLFAVIVEGPGRVITGRHGGADLGLRQG